MSKSRYRGRRAEIGVIIANTGTPDAPAPKAVKKYLSQFLMDRRIRPLPRLLWWCLLHTVILRRRSRASAAKYQAIWTEDGSPLISYTSSLERGLNDYYQNRQLSVLVRAAMSYGQPSLRMALADLKAAGCEKIIVLPMYPQPAFSTFGSVQDATKKALRKERYKGEVVYIEGYAEDPIYVRAIAASIRKAGFDENKGDRLLFSYHSIPLKDIEAGDTYELETGATSLAVASNLSLNRRSWTISYQSRFDKGRTWLSPFTRPTLVRLAQAAQDNSRLFMVCPNFSVDCLETLYDIPFELEPLYRAALAGESVDADDEPGAVENTGLRSTSFMMDPQASVSDDEAFIYVPCLNKSKAHIKVLTHVLASHVGDAW